MLVLRLLSFCGLLLSGYLLLAYGGADKHVVGCGSGSGCANVLGSRWSQWFYIPVSGLSLLLYAALLVLSFKPWRHVLLAIATCLTTSALWFAFVQAFHLKSFCPWCLAAHAIGLSTAALIFRTRSGAAPAPGITVGLLAAAILIVGQILGPVPDTHLESQVVLKQESASSGPLHSRGEGRKVSFLGSKVYNATLLPHLGNPEAPYVVVEYYDYTCDSCRELNEHLEAFLEKHPGKICVILLPCPLHRACNPHLPAEIDNHDHACELARLALACWRSDPASFAAVHHELYSRPLMDPAKALVAVTPLLSKPLAPEPLKDPWIDELLAADAEDYRRICVLPGGATNFVMPKLLVGGTRMLHGVTKSRESLSQALEQELKASRR